MTLPFNSTPNALQRQYDGTETRTLNLALQGCGSHGAFGWGILDKLLEDGRITIDGLTATSTGAMNAVIYAYGEMKGGREQARAQLELFWRKISEKAGWRSTLQRSPLGAILAAWEPLSHLWLQGVTQVLSPYEFNPFNIDPMRDILETVIDFDELQRSRATQLTIYATNIRTGRARIFTNRQINADSVLAAACQPSVSHAVQIEGEQYWDGIYSGYPALGSLTGIRGSRDLLIGQICPINRRDIPRQAADIQNRIGEIVLHNAFLNEARTLAATTKMIDAGWIKPEHKATLPRIHVHMIRSDEVMADLPITSKFDTSWRFLTKLRDAGRLAAELWLETNFNKVGVKSTIDLPPELL